MSNRKRRKVWLY